MSIDFIADQFSHGEYGFTKLDRGDFARVRQWLDSPHVAEWWTPSEMELNAVQTDEAGYAAYIVDHAGLPFAYIQIIDAAFDPVLSEELDFPKGTIKLDQFVGDAQMVGFGHGVKFIKAFVAAMKENEAVKKLLVAPSKDNVFAARSYSQAGFRPEKTMHYMGVPVSVMGQKVA